jgi:hypothetical protein
MNKKLWVAAGVAFVGMYALDFVMHGLILQGDHARTPELFRNPELKHHLSSVLGYLLFGLAFAWIYVKGFEAAKPAVGQGVRYGVAVGLLFHGYNALGAYGVQPITAVLAIKWFILGLIELAILGALVALAYGRGEEAKVPAM